MVGVGEPLSDEVDQGRRREGDRLKRVKQDKLGFEMLNGGVETSQVVWGIET